MTGSTIVRTRDSTSRSEWRSARRAKTRSSVNGASAGRGYRAAAAATGSDEDGLDRAAQAMLDRLITAEQHPHVRRIVDAGAFGPGPGSGDPFAFGLDRVLDGVAVLLDSRR